jgi:N,N'-diacetyllegionaminate synthase
MIKYQKKVYVIAEVGSNHSGKIINCIKAVKAAKDSGADCVKFQLYDEKTIAHPKQLTLGYIKNNKFKFQRDRFKSLKLDFDKIKKIHSYCKKINIDFCVTPFDHKLVKRLSKYVNFFKIASGDINYLPLLKEVKKTGKKCIISTGMSEYKDIRRALTILGKKKTSILHCIASYPTNFNDCNLENIKYLKKEFKVPVGFSDHTSGIEASMNSVFFGAEIIEKHFLPSEKIKKVADYELSIKPSQMKQMTEGIKNNINMVGSIKNKVLKCEKYFSINLKRSLYFSEKFSEEKKITLETINFLRPYNKKGIKLENYTSIVGKRLKKKVKKHELVCKKHFF